MKLRSSFIGTPGRYSSLLGTLAAIVGLFSFLDVPQRSPETVQGKTPKKWAQFLTAHPTEIQHAPPTLGPALVPHLIAEIQRSANPRYGDLSFTISCWLLEHAPEAFLKWVPEPVPTNERRLNAVILLGELGPLANAAVPVLIPLLNDPMLQCSVVLTLQAIGRAARPAVPKMLQLLREDPDLRLAIAVANLAPEDPEVIRTLAELSCTGHGNLRLEAAAALKVCTRKLNSALALLKSETPEIVP